MRVWDQWEESSKQQVLGSWKTCTGKISVSNVELWEACHCLIWAIRMADICLALKRDTETENHQSVEKQVLQVCSQYLFELEASVVVWEAVWHVFSILEDKSGCIVLYSLEAWNTSGRKTCKGSITVV